MSCAVWLPAGSWSCQTEAQWPGGVMVVGLLLDCSSDTPCTDMFLCAVWIPLSDPPHCRSCHHCNQKPDMSILVMDGPHPLHHHHHRLTHMLPSMKRHHDTFRLFGSFVSYHRLFALSAESDRLIPPSVFLFLSQTSSQSLLTGLTLSAPKLHVNTRAWPQNFCLSGWVTDTGSPAKHQSCKTKLNN